MSTKYFPLRDPISSLHKVSVEGKWVDLQVYVHGQLCGTLRCAYAELWPVLALFIGRVPVAEEDDHGNIEWFFDYDKEIVVSDEGALVKTAELV